MPNRRPVLRLILGGLTQRVAKRAPATVLRAVRRDTPLERGLRRVEAGLQLPGEERRLGR